MKIINKNQATYFNIPGLKNSGPEHWQSIWETKNSNKFNRIQQKNWETPDMITWTNQLEVSYIDITERYDEIILIGHSIGCATIVHWANLYSRSIRGALLVAPSDPEQESYPSYITGFAPLPKDRLPFPSIVVASTNDHVVSPQRARYFANCWGSQYHEIANAGHFEPKSGIGEFTEGLKLLETL